MNPYSDIPFYIQSLLSDEDDYGVVLLLTLTPRYVAPEEYVDIFGMKIKKSGFKPIDWKNIVKSDLPRSKRTSLPWEVGTIISFDPLEYGVTREKAPLYEMGQAGDLSKYRLPIMRADPPGGTLFHISPIEPCPFPSPKSNTWNLLYDNVPEEGDWKSIQYLPRVAPIDYIKTEIYLDAKPEIPVKTIDITFNIEKEGERDE